MFEVKIILDSVADNGKRITTLTATYPRFIHSEVMTHRDRARNAASSRAIPWPAMYTNVDNDPVIPLRWGSEKKGMQVGDELDPEASAECTRRCILMRDFCLEQANEMHKLGAHKSQVNRYVEPWMWITTLMTATEWNNFFRLRVHADAEMHFQKIAGMMLDAMEDSIPVKMHHGEWHLPFVGKEDFSELTTGMMCKISVARCARVSYLTHEGVRDWSKDLELYNRLVTGSGFGHWSPHEHVATPQRFAENRSGPFLGWKQFRKQFPMENLSG